jgi:ATP-dependent Zn protease
MTFVPYGRGTGKPVSVQRTIVFWLMMIALAVVLWQMASKNAPSSNSASAMSYSELMNNVDRKNIATAKLIESQSTAELQGTLRQPVESFQVTVPKEVIPNLTETLRKQGVSIEVVERKEASGSAGALALAALATVLSAVVVIVMKRKRSRAATSGGTPPMQNQPLGD